ncbi:MAG: hypothetical protein JW893_09730 [Candidatus Omnitrophica bacterium]|nr:hypothetical protein [Candidatus Omnitrophota bacterium]
MKKITSILFVALTLTLMPSLASAASPWTEEATYGAKMTGKLDYGMKNILGGWTALFSEPYNYKQEGKNVIAGAGMGFVKTMTYTLGGVLHVITFPITSLDVPLLDGGVEL